MAALEARWSCVALVVALSIWPSAARSAAAEEAAPEHGPASDADRLERAEALLSRGVELRRQGQEEQALESFAAAYRLVPSARARGQMGLVARALRLYADAERYLNEALADTTDPWVVEHRRVLEDSLAFAGKNLAWLSIESNARGATLVVNGRDRLTLPLARPLRVDAGAVRVEVHAQGHRSHSATYVVPAQGTTTLQIELEREVVPRTVSARSGAAPAGMARPSERSPSGQPRRTAAYVLGAVSLVGLTLGGYFAVRTVSLKEDRDRICPERQCPTAHGVELDEQARASAAYSVLGFTLGGLALGAGAYLFLTAPAPARAPQGAGLRFGFRIQPAPTPRASALFEYAM